MLFPDSLENNQSSRKAVIRGGNILTALFKFESALIMSENRNSNNPPKKAPMHPTSSAPQNLPSTFLFKRKKEIKAAANPIIKYISAILK